MRPRHFIFLASVLIVLAALAFIKKADRQRQERAAAQAGLLSTALTGDIDKESVHTIVLYKGDPSKKIVFSRQGDGWILVSRNGIRALTDRVDRLLKGMNAIRGDVRGNDAASFGIFGIADDHGVHVVLKDEAGTEIAHVIFGLNTPRPGVAFCRLAGSTQTQLVESGVPKILGMGDEPFELSDASFVDWRIYPDRVKGAVRLDIANPAEKAPFALLKGADGTWSFDPPERRRKPDTAKVEGFLNALSTIRGGGFAEPKEGSDDGLRAPAVRIVATVSGAGDAPAAEAPVVYELSIGGKTPDDAGMYYARALPQDLVYRVPESAAAGLIVTRQDFMTGRRRK
ncbi:MAG: DUF4340 domain-containing protein [Deltaproteobacteria bacterium]